jgi:serine/threonine-protein kinase
MELIEGRTLEELVGRRRLAEELARLIAQAARALAAAHAAGVVHRDIKPTNLMVRDDGIVKVLDFGLVRRLPTDPDGSLRSASRTTDPGAVAGTPRYLSPEQVRAQAVGAASDVFSLGVVLYELATGRHPFPADSEAGLLHAILADVPLPPARLNPEVLAALDALILQMLAKDPSRRPTASDAEAALAGQAGNRGGPTPGSQPRPERPPTVGRHPERAALWAGFEEAAAGRGLLVSVTGELGLGKTTWSRSSWESWRPAGGSAASAGGVAPSGWPERRPTCPSWRRWTAALPRPWPRSAGGFRRIWGFSSATALGWRCVRFPGQGR